MIRDRNLTFDECAEALDRLAYDSGEPGTLSTRHLQRLVAGRRPNGSPLGPIRPATARLLERFFERDISALLRPPDLPASDNSAVELQHLVQLSGRVDASVIHLLRGQLNSIRRLDRQFGAIVTHDEVKAKIKQVRHLRTHSLRPDTRASLATVESELCTLAGWQALDLGNPQQAWGHYEDAKAAAREIPDPNWLVHATAEQSVVLLDLDHPTAAVDLVGTLDLPRAMKLAPSIRSWCFAALGEAHAAVGDERASLTSFDLADKYLSTPETTGPYVALDAIHLARWRGHALARLGKREAPAVLEAALADLDPTFVRAAAGLRIDLAVVHCSLNEPDRASSHAREAASVAAEIGSTRQVKRALAFV
ncbi:hypothetical protein [Actinokineospora inagensis]|uniref:hypothetical protein n=1 Tax=Actinokineospora inagensis TaxID=103730 RepID=UPI0003FBC54F|nr:hypothetical protein [Actinokineospora inagensis]